MPAKTKTALERLKLANEQRFKTGKRERVDTGFDPKSCGFTPAQFVSLSPSQRLALFNAWLAAKLAAKQASRESSHV